jgi:hypothetical protein
MASPDNNAASPARRSTDRDRELQALLADYSFVRDDERQQTLALAALFTILGAVIFAEATQLLGGCDNGGSQCLQTSPIFYALAPAPCFAVLALTILIGTEATMRYAYMLGLEEQIRDRVPKVWLDSPKRPAFSWQEARRPIVVFGAGSFSRFPFPWLYSVMIVPVIAIVLALTIYCTVQIQPASLAILAGSIYAGVSAFLSYAAALGWIADLWLPWPEDDGDKPAKD